MHNFSIEKNIEEKKYRIFKFTFWCIYLYIYVCVCVCARVCVCGFQLALRCCSSSSAWPMTSLFITFMFDLSRIIHWSLIIQQPQYQYYFYIVRGKTTVFEQHFLGVLFSISGTRMRWDQWEICVRWKMPLVLHVLLWTTQTIHWLLGSQVNGFYTNH